MAKRTGTKKPAEADGNGAVATAAVGGRGGRGKGFPRGGRGTAYTAGAAKNRHLVIVESPSKAKTINKYLGPEYLVLASVGHVRDLPSKNPKGVKSPVPGVDLEHQFKPTYEVLSGKDKVVSDLKRAAKESIASGKEVWFATDLDREGEAIAWHLAQELGIKSGDAKRVIFAAITKGDIEKAFSQPHPIDEDRVNAQQARRILDRIVGYQVSPLLWKKVARGLSAGRVQSVAVRLVVEREREIRAFMPDEFWEITAEFAITDEQARKLGPAWEKFLAGSSGAGVPPAGGRDGRPTVKEQNAWLNQHSAVTATLVEIAGKKFVIEDITPDLDIEDMKVPGATLNADIPVKDLTPQVASVAKLAGLTGIKVHVTEDEKGKGPERFRRTVTGRANPDTPYKVISIETKRTSVRPSAPFITSSLQQAASTRLGFGAQRTMRAAQQLYEGVDIPGEGPVGLITYMRTDSTTISGDALTMARDYIGRTFGEKYLPEKPNFFSSSNKAAQEAHEAIRPTNIQFTPSRVKNALTPDQFRLYQIVWERFVACQMVPAQWDSTAVLIQGGTDPKRPLTFRATGRTLVFDGFYKVSGIPTAADEQTLPKLAEQQPLFPFAIDPVQKFNSPPPRYSEASLIKKLEEEGIGRPSTYASIIGVIQDRKYVEQQQRRFYSTDLGEVVTDKLIEAFPQIMDVGYTREMEIQLDKIEEDHLDWVKMLQRFYGPFTKDLENAHENLSHAKAESIPAPAEFKCADCGSPTVYRFGKSGRFLSCSRYPDCKWASPVDRDGRPRPQAEHVDIACPKCGGPMTRRTGRFGPFLGCARYGDKAAPCDGILNIDRKGKVQAPSSRPVLTDLPCPTCQAPMNLRPGVRGPWLGCSRFPKCRGRGKWTELPEDRRKSLERELEAHLKANPIPIIRTMSGKPLTDVNGKPLAEAPTVDQLAGGSGDAAESGASSASSSPEPEEVGAE